MTIDELRAEIKHKLNEEKQSIATCCKQCDSYVYTCIGTLDWVLSLIEKGE